MLNNLTPHSVVSLVLRQILSQDECQNSNPITDEAEDIICGFKPKLGGAVPEEHLHDLEEHALSPVSLRRRKLLQTDTPSDGNVLLQFKQAIVEDPGGVLLGWNGSANDDYCQWRGVTCDQRTKRVVGLNITGIEV